MNTKKTRLLAVLMILAFGATACSPQAGPEDTVPQAAPVALGAPVLETVEETYVTIGEVIPNNQLDIYLGNIGEIDRVFIHPGDYIEEDMPLIQLTNENSQATFTATESQLRTIRDNLAVQYNAALEAYNLQKKLFDTGTISQDTLDASRDQLTVAQRSYRDAQVSYSNQISTLQSTVDDLLVKAPITGQVADLNVQRGQTARGQLAVSLIDKSRIYVRTMVAGQLKKDLVLGQEVRLSLEGADQTTPGRVSAINEIPDLASKLFEIRVEIMEDMDPAIGDYAEVEFVTRAYEALLVPAGAVVRKGIEKYVFTYEKDALKKITLETGLSKDGWVEVITGDLTPASPIVIRGQNELREGDSVTVTP